VAVFIALFAAGIAIFISQRNAGQSPPAPPDKTDKPADSAIPGAAADFDFYLLAMTLHPAFCADGHGGSAECRSGRPVPLSIHGLWPERLARNQIPRDCAGPRLDLEPALAQDLRQLMPGMAENLHQHEWRKHGTCSGLGDDEYYQHTLDLARRVDAVFSEHLTSLAGRRTTADELRRFAEDRQAGIGGSLTFHCRTLRDAPIRNEPYLIEIRQCVDNDGAGGAPGTLLDCEDVQRADQGCGRSFHIAESARR
jgi:ribonuclease T2